MDKKTVIALVISFVIIVLYPQYLKMIAPPAPVETTIEHTETALSVTPDMQVSANKVVESVQEIIQNIEEQEIVLSNGISEVILTNKSGSIKRIAYTLDADSSEVVLYQEDMATAVPTVAQVRLRDLRGGYFFDDSRVVYTVKEQSASSVVFESPVIEGVQVTKTISLDRSFDETVAVSVKNTTDHEIPFVLEFSSGIAINEKLLKEPDSTHVVVSSEAQVSAIKTKKIERQGYSAEKYVDWLAADAKYSIAIVKPNYPVRSFRSLIVTSSAIMNYTYSDEIVLPSNESKELSAFSYYGPKEYDRLKEYKAGFEGTMYRGFFGFLKLYLLITLNFFYKIFHNYGVAIILLTICIKVLFAPLTHKSFESMRKMQALQPQMKALQEKYKNDPQHLNKEVMELYKKHKANPFGGCLPLLLQMPIFIALYQALSQSVELKGAPFIWWIKDLSEPDRLYTFATTLPIIGNSINVLPILMIGSMIWQQKLTPSTGNKEQEKMMLIMSGVFGIIFYTLPSGLVLYWFVNNILTIIHQSFHRKKAQ